MAPHINLYLFEHRPLRADLPELKYKVEEKDKTLMQMDKMCREFQLRVDLLIEKVNRLGNY